MGQILRVKMRWAGFTGAPGLSVFHMKDFASGDVQAPLAQDAVDRVDTFAEALRGLIPYQATLTVQSDVEVLEDTTGELLDVVTVAPDAAHVSLATNGQEYAGPVGAVITWRTAGIRNGRRIRGRTFIVPMVSAAFDGNGQIDSVAHPVLVNAAAALRADTGTPDLGVWARPTPILDGSGNPTGNYNEDGQWTAVTGSSVPTFGAVLRSRRD